jgi:hypothetical protein
MPLLGIILLLSCAGCAVQPSAGSDGPAKYLSQAGPAASPGTSLSFVSNADQPSIKGIQTLGITSSGATVTWTADYPLSGIVQWGKTTDYKFTQPVAAEPGGQSTVRLTGLTPSTKYYYRITLTSNSGKPITSPTQAFETLEPLNAGPMLISGINVSGISGDSATITWTTSLPSSGQVEYGTTLPYGNITPPDARALYSHTVILTSLIDNTSYYFRVSSTDPAGNVSTSVDTVFVTANVERMAVIMNMSRLASRCGCKGHRYGR